MAFSPDSSKLAIAQTDNIVFVYKLGQKWGEKKTICNKYPQSSTITTLCWPNAHLNEIFFGLSEGKVKLGNIRTNKSSTVYATDEYVVSMCSSPDGTTLLAGHVDGSVYVFSVSSSGSVTKNKLLQHVSVPGCLSWGESIAVAGNDLKLYFYDSKGVVLQKFDYTHDDNENEFNSAEFSPSGGSLVIGSFNKFRTYTFNGRKKVWEESGVHDVKNYYSFTAISWKKDGSRVATGSLAGAVDLYDACLRRLKYKGKFEMVYVSPSQVIVKRLSNGS
jgi:intraflagellar transport protein 172